MTASTHAGRRAGSHADIVQHRPRLLGLAYRMLGDVDDSEDVVQEAYLRWHREPRDDVRSAEAWLVTVTTRLAVDRLRRAAADRARYVGPWLPEPIPTPEPERERSAPDRPVELASDLSVALLVLLERLAPEERAAFLLREVFGTDYDEIARILERRPDAVRQMVSRARRRVREDRQRVAAPPDAHQRLLDRFMAALAADDRTALLEILAPDVVIETDGGGVVRAARNRVHGADRVARFLLGLTRKFGDGMEYRLGRLNGVPALLAMQDGTINSATVFAVDGERIRAVYTVLHPEKLRRVMGRPVVME